MAELDALHLACRCQFRWRLSLWFGRSYIRLPVSFGVRMRARTSVSQQERRVPTPEQLGGAPRNAELTHSGPGRSLNFKYGNIVTRPSIRLLVEARKIFPPLLKLHTEQDSSLQALILVELVMAWRLVVSLGCVALALWFPADGNLAISDIRSLSSYG